MIKVAINGFGRIGRNILRAHYESGRKHGLQFVAINDLGDAATNAHLLKYDTVHGPFRQAVQVKDKGITIGDDSLQVRPGLRLAREEAGAFHHEIDAERLPGQLGRVALGHDLDAVVVDDDAVAIHAHRRRKAPVRGVVLQQVGVGLRVAQVVDRDELQIVFFLAAFTHCFIVGPQHHASDAPKTVDGYLDHPLIHPKRLLTASATRSGVKPKCLKSSPTGADSPKRSMPTTLPSRPTYLRQ